MTRALTLTAPDILRSMPDALRSMIVLGCALALIFADRALPF